MAAFPPLPPVASGAARGLAAAVEAGRSAAGGRAPIEVGGAFQQELMRALRQVNATQLRADELSRQLVTGQASDVAQVVIETEKAHLSLQLMLQVRNKLLDAYQEIMRMQV